MNKSELVAAVAEKSGLSKANTDKAVKAVFGTLTETLAKGEDVTVFGFGTFGVKERAARQGFNPRTKEPVQIAASKAVGFRPAKALKEAVNVKKKPQKKAKKSKKK